MKLFVDNQDDRSSHLEMIEKMMSDAKNTEEFSLWECDAGDVLTQAVKRHIK